VGGAVRRWGGEGAATDLKSRQAAGAFTARSKKARGCRTVRGMSKRRMTWMAENSTKNKVLYDVKFERASLNYQSSD
jgi:hypothetical protein